MLCLQSSLQCDPCSSGLVDRPLPQSGQASVAVCAEVAGWSPRPPLPVQSVAPLLYDSLWRTYIQTLHSLAVRAQVQPSYCAFQAQPDAL